MWHNADAFDFSKEDVQAARGAVRMRLALFRQTSPRDVKLFFQPPRACTQQTCWGSAGLKAQRQAVLCFQFYSYSLRTGEYNGVHKTWTVEDEDGTGWDGTERDGMGRDGTGLDGAEWNGTGRDGTGRDGP